MSSSSTQTLKRRIRHLLPFNCSRSRRTHTSHLEHPPPPVFLPGFHAHAGHHEVLMRSQPLWFIIPSREWPSGHSSTADFHCRRRRVPRFDHCDMGRYHWHEPMLFAGFLHSNSLPSIHGAVQQ
ncbi:hypothetical protein BOTBODRAFT_252185 [Botryobasidium botryosum FD-172 SS1]|uniref:Uncharacterized protein n=1 Tax=Botryobasidium botryosum (strain FD-172 SS1) TaxID=930990 RepID=A0A067MYD7_BOTB1|nr:hypothetical protein BOTBODRAFT_252185 [Botryobasidium botryosum FD-172 SS1]